jgi:Resolvase, N terminal domain
MRMSTHRQRYSIENQAAAIAAYAAEYHLDIVQSYVDKGRSGLAIDQRKGLQELIADVEAGRVEFDFILEPYRMADFDAVAGPSSMRSMPIANRAAGAWEPPIRRQQESEEGSGCFHKSRQGEFRDLCKIYRGKGNDEQPLNS